MSRWDYARGIVSKWSAALTAAYALVSAYDLAVGQLWDRLPRVADITSLDIPLYVYALGFLGILVLSVFEGGYRRYRTIANKHGEEHLIEATPDQGANMTPTTQGATVWEVHAYLDVKTVDGSKPLRNCRIKLLELEHYDAWTEKGSGEVKGSWQRDSFYQGQTYFFSWSGRPVTVDAVDVHKRERASIAKCIDTVPELTTTAGKVGHLFHGDQYHLTVEITADNSLPLSKEYWLQMHEGSRPVIEEWDANPR